MLASLSRHQMASAILTIIYTVGIIGLISPYKDSFVMLTPINLLVSMGIIVWQHSGKYTPLLKLLALSYLFGFSIEVLGVQTGLIFGEYQYGDVLGFKILGTPLMIGINWAMLVYGSGSLVNSIQPQSPILLKSIIGAGMMTILDIFIEPVAIEYKFWFWANDIVPLQNYIAWFLIALPLLFAYFKFLGTAVNKTAITLFILQFIFFISLQL